MTRLAAWAALTAAALVALLAWTLPESIEHRGQIHAIGAQLTICTAESERYGESGTRTLEHLTRCAKSNNELRRELGDEVSVLLLLALTGSGVWFLAAASRR
ncbi:hypothetical protein AB0E69_19950 [Kribbella sp. NPDC026611]|uniref:hypothetical protein n=1 Tax=Kribbella sp. NPDC026611 TaxID=3154911 RepID=UPI0033EDC8DB